MKNNKNTKKVYSALLHIELIVSLHIELLASLRH